MFAETENGVTIHVPRNIGHYFTRRVLGTGSTCVVVEAQDLGSGKLFAIKVISKSDMTKKNLINKIEREIEVVQTLDCEYVVRCVEVIRDGDLIFVVMEYCTGGDLLSWIIDDKFEDETQVKEIFQQIVKGVKYLHDHGIAHGDIKPENVMMDENGTPKLTDFGYCHTSLMCGNDEKSGTLFYAAPELFLSGLFNTQKTDIWALGVTLFAMSTGQFPYEEGDDQFTIGQILQGRILWPKSMNDETREFIEKLMAFSPDARPMIDDVLNDEYFNELYRTPDPIKNRHLVPSDFIFSDSDVLELPPVDFFEM